MNKQQLASLIWDTCNDMRGSISAVEYKDIILGFIFYRFVSENEVSYLKKQDWTMEIMAEELTEKDSETVQQCKDHLGYFIAYKDLFSTWKDHTATFTVSDVTDALNGWDGPSVLRSPFRLSPSGPLEHRPGSLIHGPGLVSPLLFLLCVFNQWNI